jgi:PDZ domain-containing secreted protein
LSLCLCSCRLLVFSDRIEKERIGKVDVVRFDDGALYDITDTDSDNITKSEKDEVEIFVSHGLITFDVDNKNFPYAYQKYGVTSMGVVIVESEYSEDFKNGDVIVSVDGMSIYSSEDIDLVLKEYSAGDIVKVLVVREGKRVEIELTLRETDPDSVSFD